MYLHAKKNLMCVFLYYYAVITTTVYYENNQDYKLIIPPGNFHFLFLQNDYFKPDISWGDFTKGFFVKYTKNDFCLYLKIAIRLL